MGRACHQSAVDVSLYRPSFRKCYLFDIGVRPSTVDAPDSKDVTSLWHRDLRVVRALRAGSSFLVAFVPDRPLDSGNPGVSFSICVRFRERNIAEGHPRIQTPMEGLEHAFKMNRRNLNNCGQIRRVSHTYVWHWCNGMTSSQNKGDSAASRIHGHPVGLDHRSV